MRAARSAAALFGVVLLLAVASGCAAEERRDGPDDVKPPKSNPRSPVATADVDRTTTAAPQKAPAVQFVGRRGVVDHVVDGDTVDLRSGATVRLVQIDTPEVFGGRECGGPFASATLKRLLPEGTSVLLETDPSLDRVDRYGRLLAYVRARKKMVNLQLVQLGAAAPWFYDGDRGRYAVQLMRAATAARAARRGVWGRCPKAVLDPSRGLSTGGTGGAADAATGAAALGTRPSDGGSAAVDHGAGLPAAPPFPPDVDCGDLAGPVRVTPDDPHGLDADGDGVGCDG